jgi:hypothetical protein
VHSELELPTAPLTHGLLRHKRQLICSESSGREILYPNVPTSRQAIEAYNRDIGYVPGLMPDLSYDTLEATSLPLNEDLSSVDEAVGDGAAIYNGRIVMFYSKAAGQLGRELYTGKSPWNLWHRPDALEIARRMIGPGLTDETLIDMPMQTVLKLYAGALLIPDVYRGPVQRRLVACVAILARDGFLEHGDLKTWVGIHMQVRNWTEMIERAGQLAPITLPDLTICFR